jgi:hypothetical protein
MKKIYVLIGIAVFTLTILNVSNIDRKTSPATLSSLFASARAGGEDPDCGYSQFYDLIFNEYYDECNQYKLYDYYCLSGFNNICQEGYVEELMMGCHHEVNNYTEQLNCL